MEKRARLFLVAIPCFLAPAYGQETNTLVLEQTIALPSVQGGLNHMAVDAGRQRLFVPAPGASGSKSWI